MLTLTRWASLCLLSLAVAACSTAEKPLQNERILSAAGCPGSPAEPVRSYGSLTDSVKTNPDCGVLPTGGALNGERYRVLITTDLPADTDDIQSLIHFFLVADLFDLEGIVSAPPTFNRTRAYMREHCGSNKKTDCIHQVIDQYELDYPNLRSWSRNYPSPDSLRKLVKSGHEQSWSDSHRQQTEGSRWIVQQAKKKDQRPLYILAWGAITNTATALMHHPEIADRIRVFMVGWSNVNKDQEAYDYIRERFPHVFFIEAEGSMFGVRYPDKTGGYDNKTLCDRIADKGAMGKYWCRHRRDYVDQDFVSVYYLLAGDPENPSSEHWGGRYRNVGANRWADVEEPQTRMDIPRAGVFSGVKTSSRWRKPRLDHLMQLFGRTARPGEALQRGFYEIHLNARVSDPYDERFFLEVEWQLPDGSIRVSDGFFDGGRLFKARAYTAQSGSWSWRTRSSSKALDNIRGEFIVRSSDLPGKLRKHRLDPYQFQFDDGSWFLHIGDTAYRYVNIDEPDWKPYLNQAARVGFTKIRTWFNHGRYDVQALFNRDRSGLRLEYWQEIDKRLRYALEKYPHLQFQLIPYGEDSREIRQYTSDPMTRLIAREAQARFSALPNIHWCIVNDREIVDQGPLNGERQVLAKTLDRIGKDMAAREPWGSLITSHQARKEGYSFVDADWSDMITLEDLDQVGGTLIREYRNKSRNDPDPVVLDEDRYELYRGPRYPDYFFRRLMWSSLLSGGHASYGGLASYEARDPQEDTRGIIGYFDSRKRSFPLRGADQFQYIHKFFRDTGLTLVDFKPSQHLVQVDSGSVTAASNGKISLFYVANPQSDNIQSSNVSDRPYRFEINHLSGQNTSLRWYNPRTGQWSESRDLQLDDGISIVTPEKGDWLAVIQH